MREHFIGTVLLFAGYYAPEGWMLCDGHTLPIRGYEALFTVIGVTYGGNGSTDFKLPNLNSKTATGQDHGTYMRFIICFAGDYPVRP